MTKFSPLRLVTLSVVWAVGSWLSLALLFAFLPSFSVSDQESNRHLSEGARITRVYDTDTYYSWYDEKPSHRAVRQAWRSNFALEYQLEYLTTSKTSLLHLGNVSIDLHELWSRIDSSLENDDDDQRSYISEPIEVMAKIGDLDGINPAWFKKADAMLLFWEIHRDNLALPLRLQVHPSKMQLWPDGASWEVSRKPPSGVYEPLLEIYNIDHFNGSMIQVNSPVELDGEPVFMSPSRTLSIRKNIQAVLVPTGLLVYHLLGIIGSIFEAIFQILYFVVQLCVFYAIIILIAWILSGRPKFGPWAQSFILTRKLFAKYKHAQQHLPVHEEQSHQVLEDERQPHPLRGPSDFFRSGNPLDDLLVTFDCTKRFVQPITWGGATSALNQSTGHVSMPNEIKLDISHRISKPSRAQRRETDWRDLEKSAG